MRKPLMYLSVATALAMTVMSGILSGMASQRWGASQAAQPLAEQLQTLPADVGDWSLQEEAPLSETVQNILQCQGHLNRVYQNNRTGRQVSVAVILGPSGPVAVHKPSICYSSRNFIITDQESPIDIDTEVGKQSLWFTEFQSKGLEKETLQTYHAWSFDGKWEATQEPRLAYMWRPYLFKIQVAAVAPPGESADEKTGIEFLKDFIPQLNDQLFSEPTANPTSTP